MKAVSLTLFAGSALALVGFVPFGAAHAATESVLYSFCSQANCTDGQYPIATLIADTSGNLYGTTSEGGANGDGEVFELAPDGTLTVLHSFNGTDGSGPQAGVIVDSSGNLYGTTTAGATGGDVFELTPDGTLTILYAFGAHGADPTASALIDNNGILYATTKYGGASGEGSVFSLDLTNDTATVLYSFCSQQRCEDGAGPMAPVIMDSSGNLYGTTAYGGTIAKDCSAGCGTVFEITAAGNEQVLYTYKNSKDGRYPFGGLTFGSGNQLFGVTWQGGTHHEGTVFTITVAQQYNVLYDFKTKKDAQLPWGAMIPDGNGGFYGTACQGGTKDDGAVFDISASGIETVIYSFQGGSDGLCPKASLLNINGTLYGTTEGGGGTACEDEIGCGTVFAIKE
jgi:uncharacterized repeat protein (TIGR03803 family)